MWVVVEPGLGLLLSGLIVSQPLVKKLSKRFGIIGSSTTSKSQSQIALHADYQTWAANVSLGKCQFGDTVFSRVSMAGPDQEDADGQIEFIDLGGLMEGGKIDTPSDRASVSYALEVEAIHPGCVRKASSVRNAT